MDCSWIAPCTPAIMVMTGWVFHPVCRMARFNGSYLACFCVVACSGNLSWQYVNSMNCTVWLGDGAIGGVV